MPPQRTILVIDDEPNVVQSVKDLLRRECRVFGATSPREGLDLLKRQEVDIVMSDQRMPEMTGVELLSQVREEHPDSIRLLFTGYADLKAVIDAINEGHVYRYIAKPWDPDELQTIIRQAGEQHDLLQERKRLLADLRERNEQLQRANADLRRASELKEAFIRVASHELRTPLTVLLGLSGLALQTPGLGPAADWIGRMYEASQRLHRLVEQILQMLRAGRFERTLVRQPADLGALVRAASEDVRPFMQKRHQELTLDVPPDLGSIAVDAGKIRDCVDNLLLNAIKFTPDGGRIQVSAGRLPDGGAEVRVRDSGVGIDPAHLPHIFETFFTEFDVSRHASGLFEFNRRGLGLGLSLVKAFVEMHGGTVQVASTPGEGSTFTITLPAA